MVHVRNKEFFLKATAATAAVALAFFLAYQASQSGFGLDVIERYGYAGVFFIAVVSGFNLIVPLPAVSLMPLFLEAGLSFWITVMLISIGMTIGDIIGYFIGRVGRTIATDRVRKKIESLEVFRETHPLLPLLVMFLFACFAPLPNEVLVIPLAVMGYRLALLAPIILLGNFIFNVWAALGYTSVFEILI